MTSLKRHRPSGFLRFSDGSKSTLRSKFRELGARTLTFGYRRMLFMSYSLDDVRIPVYNTSLGVSFGTLQPRDIDAYLRFRKNAWRSEIEQRLMHGDRCYVSWSGSEIVDACWTATGLIYVPYMHRYLRIPPGSVYSYDSYTAPELRGRGIYMARNSYTAREHQSEGLSSSIALVAYENYSAWLILTRSGLKTLGAYHYVRTPLTGIYWETVETGQTLPPLVRERSRTLTGGRVIGATSES